MTDTITITGYKHSDIGSTCDLCGTYIKHIFTATLEGKSIIIGADCAEKKGGKQIAQSCKNTKYKVEHADQIAKAQAEQERKATIGAEARAKYVQLLKQAKRYPHPNDYFASKGKTLEDYIEYFDGNTDHFTDEDWFYGKGRTAKAEQLINERA